MAFEILTFFFLFCLILYSCVLHFKLGKLLIKSLRTWFLVCKTEISYFRGSKRIKNIFVKVPRSSMKNSYHHILLWRHKAGWPCAVLQAHLQGAPCSGQGTTKKLNIFPRPPNSPSHTFIPRQWFVKPKWILKKKKETKPKHWYRTVSQQLAEAAY